jgi:hypothetical protein
MEDNHPTVPISPWSDPAEPSRPSPPHPANSTLLGISLGLNVGLLFFLLVVLLLARSGVFAAGSIASNNHLPTTAPTSNPNSALSSSTAHPVTPTAPAFSGGLQVTPSQVQLGCKNGQQTQFVVLMNASSDRISWQAELPVPTDQAGVSISPNQGDLKAGTSVTLQIQNRSHSSGQQGTIRFATDPPGAGSSASVSYTAMGCD